MSTYRPSTYSKGNKKREPTAAQGERAGALLAFSLWPFCFLPTPFAFPLFIASLPSTSSLHCSQRSLPFF